MPLDEYARKRSFDKTPEPAPALAAAEGRRFCVQRHSARRLHYDLRLEIGGAMKSWAVPEGPTLDPAVKRLAVHVEDHPLEYAHFEGNIPKGNYGAGSVMLWDIGVFEVLDGKPAEAQLERGDFKFRLHGKKLAGDFALVRLKNSAKGNEWLLIKKQDAAARTGWDAAPWAYSVRTLRTQEEIALDAPAKVPALTPEQLHAAPATGAQPASMPGFFSPMLATLAAEPPASAAAEDWIYEIKWDGVRALCFLDPDGVRLHGRKGPAIHRTYPELAALRELLRAQSAVIDGEVVALDDAGRPSFQLLQPRIMATESSAAAFARSRPVTLFAFDLVYLNGWDLRDSPLAERRRLLEALIPPKSPLIRFSAAFDVPPDHLLEVARAQGLEGIVAKRRMSRYQAVRSPDWIKIKVIQQQEFVIAGYQLGERDGFASLILGAFHEGRLVYVGNVGTGFDRKMIESLRALLDERKRARCPFPETPKLLGPPVWTKPDLVCSVRFNSWTAEPRLRAPVFAGLRNDIDPAECIRDAGSATAAAPSRPPLLAPGKDDVIVTVDSRKLHFTHLDKIYFPASERNKEPYRKRDVLNYYHEAAEFLVPHWRDRPLNLKRYPEGVTGEAFFQKNAASGFPEWMRSGLVIDVDGKEKLQVIGAGRPELLYLAQLGCIDQNPWMSRVGSLDHPDFLLIDLDPVECDYDKIVEAALVVRRRLEQLGLTGYPKTTGGDGMHIYVPLEPVYLFEQTRAFAEILCRLVAGERPDLFTMPRLVAQREKGKVYFDYAQNARGKTISAPYVLRAHPGAPVATPLDWRELSPSLRPWQFHIRNAIDRFDRVGDLFRGVLDNPQRLEPAMVKLESLLAETAAGGRTRAAGS